MILGLFVSFSFLFTLVISQGSLTAQKQTHVDSKATSCNINNNFYAGPNKKMENLILDVKRQLDEIRKDLKISPKNENYKPQDLPYYNNSSEPCKSGQRTVAKNKVIKKNCAELYNVGYKSSGVYTIDPDGSGAFDVFCDQRTAGGGWTVFQKRLDGSVNFYLGWADYKNGFGNLSGEFWLGLDKLHRLTISDWNKLRVDLADTDGDKAYAEYELFAIASEKTNYKLSLGTYSGTAGDSLTSHNGKAFTTKDKDNDDHGYNCAVLYNGAWWYHDQCHHSNLNGLYHHGKHSSYGDGVNWNHWKGQKYSAKRAEMKIKPVKFQ